MHEPVTVTLHFKGSDKPKTFHCSHVVFLDHVGNWLALLNDKDEPFFSIPKENIEFVEYIYDAKDSKQVKH